MRKLTEKEKERNALIEQWFPLACKLAKVIRTSNYLHEDDRLDAAIQGLFEAATHYNGKIPFPQYAAFVIKREIKIEAWQNRNVRLPRYMRLRIMKYLKGDFVPKGRNWKLTLICITAAQEVLQHTTNDFDLVEAKPEIDPIELKEYESKVSTQRVEDQ